MSDRFRVTYALTCGAGEDAAAKAADLALEQTVELPHACLPPHVARDVAGSVETIEHCGNRTWRVVVAYPAATVGDDLLQFVNLLFGNASLLHGIRITHTDVPGRIRDRCGGPRFGVSGIRELCGVGEGRPLLCAAAKPVGLTARELADICAAFVAGGIDIVKDDHGLANQEWAPFAERVVRCQDAVEAANARTGGSGLYFPHVGGGGADLEARLELARSVGCRGVLLSPLLVGLETVRDIAARAGLAVLAHPALAGAFFAETHGMAPDVLVGSLFRLVGSDGVIYPNVGGRFPFTRGTCDAINARLREPWDGIRPALPVPAGGIDVARVPHWIAEYGTDTMFLIGASLYAQRDLTRATERLVAAVRAQCASRT